MLCEKDELLTALGMVILLGAIHGDLLSRTNPFPPSHDERDRLPSALLVLVDGARRLGTLEIGSSKSSTSAFEASEAWTREDDENAAGAAHVRRATGCRSEGRRRSRDMRLCVAS